MAEIVYEPDIHIHSMSRRVIPELIGKIEKCECGKYFYLANVTGSNCIAKWRTVRWYHWNKRSRIKQWEGK